MSKNKNTEREDRGPDAKKDSLDKRLQNNAELERKSGDKDKSSASIKSDLDEALDDSFPSSDPPARTPTDTPASATSAMPIMQVVGHVVKDNPA